MLLSISLLTGCKDASEVDDKGYSIVIGIDKEKNNKIVLTIQYPNYEGGGSSSGGQGSQAGGAAEIGNVHSIEAPSVLTGFDLMNMAVSRKITLMHIRMIIISEELAREGVSEYLAPLIRFRETRKTAFIVITKGKAKREFVGTAVFSGDKMVGTLNPTETRYMLMLINKFESGFFTISDEKKSGKLIAFNIRPGRKTKVKGSFDGDTPVIDVKLNLEADIGGIESRFDYESLENIENLNKQLEKHLKEGIQKTISKTQNELKADVFEFGTKIAGHFFNVLTLC